jgi:hypothetical protein
MNRNSKSLFTLTGVTFAGLVTVAMLNLSQVVSDDRNVFCGNIDNAMLDHELPVSHPVNKCAGAQSKGVSWSQWFTGRSSSYQFHFIDLLELLSRTGNNETKNPSTAN